MKNASGKWNSPQDWLREVAWDWDNRRLTLAVAALASCLDNDSIEALFQDEMTADGYFGPVAVERKLVFDLWSFIENCNYDDPRRDDRFFALRERIRELQQEK